ncbi:hypothetical protein CAPTEDRAFT_104940, partial [Capitella teleta]
PAYSHDLSQIEHLWNQLKTTISHRLSSPCNRSELIAEWGNIPQARIRTLCNSIRRRCTECVVARGGHTQH